MKKFTKAFKIECNSEIIQNSIKKWKKDYKK